VARVGGSVGAGVVALTGGGGSGATTTVVESASVASSSSASSASGLDAAALYRSTSPGVVDITATGTGSASSDPFGQGSGQSTATGSGFVVDRSGHIVTAEHVIDGATSVKVTFADGTTRTATIVGQDNATDVAVLRVDPSGLSMHQLRLGSPGSLYVGDAVMAIGSPFGYEESPGTGVVSGLDRTIQAPNGFTLTVTLGTQPRSQSASTG